VVVGGEGLGGTLKISVSHQLGEEPRAQERERYAILGKSKGKKNDSAGPTVKFGAKGGHVRWSLFFQTIMIRVWKEFKTNGDETPGGGEVEKLGGLFKSGKGKKSNPVLLDVRAAWNTRQEEGNGLNELSQQCGEETRVRRGGTR